jgi:hypothetical protein
MEEIEFKNTVMGQITRDALMNWNQLSLEEAEEKVQEYGNAEVASNNVTYGSELSSVRGIAQAIGLTEEQAKQLEIDINTKDKVSPELASEINKKIQSKGLEETIIEILGVIHDGWVKDNPNKFEARPKNYQFVTLKLLDFKEASLDLLFLQPILEACGISIDIEALQDKFLQEQDEYLKEQSIYSHDDLVKKLSMGEEFYPVLEGLETNKGVKGGEKTLITDLLKDKEIVEKMASQVEERIVMPTLSLEQKANERNRLEEEAEKITEAERLIKSLENEKNKDGQQIGG